jgi:hypothetical protein
VVRIGAPNRPLPPDCKLELVVVAAENIAPNGRLGAEGEYEMIGAVTIGAHEGTDAMSEEIRSLVRPRACEMGGGEVSLLASGTDANAYGHSQQSIVFQVW